MIIENGKTTALVGLSGAGKSTIINLLCKFYLPDSGEILLDKVDLNEFENAYLRNDLGLVLQKNHIFQGSIEDNIRYGNMNAGFEEIEEAAKKAYLHEQILDLPENTSMTPPNSQADNNRELPLPDYSSKIHRLFSLMNQRQALMRLPRNRLKIHWMRSRKEGQW